MCIFLRQFFFESLLFCFMIVLVYSFAVLSFAEVTADSQFVLFCCNENKQNTQTVYLDKHLSQLSIRVSVLFVVFRVAANDMNELITCHICFLLSNIGKGVENFRIFVTLEVKRTEYFMHLSQQRLHNLIFESFCWVVFHKKNISHNKSSILYRFVVAENSLKLG